jgi:antitoxin (DNA-binding transcriptional repressor) of toxin-antitoxin stability system
MTIISGHKGEFMKTIAAGVFKAKCLSLLDEVSNAHETIVVTKHGIPVAKIGPVLKARGKHGTSLHGSVLSEKDILSPIEEVWEAGQ